ncbi:DUF2283 domain-containing protein [Kitasatospora sp. NPDC056327]|uniref:DUF2283 domain-containing protein n=1 Tax=Kitasatospora sp. NPDC056327 TaxID=3345785 RepID=UPI0035DAF561
MHVTHDPEAPAAYLRLVPIAPGAAVRQLLVEDTTGDLVLDFDAEGRLLGIELLAPEHQLHPALRPVPGRT